MALVQATLETELLKLFDSTRPDFAGYPATVADVGTAWAAAYNTYARAAQDLSLDTLLLANQAGFASALTASLPPGTPGGTALQAAQAFEAAFTAYWALATFNIVAFLPGWAVETASEVTVVTPGVLQNLLLTEFAIQSTDVATKATAMAAAFHAATTTAVLVTISGTSVPPPGPLLVVGPIA